MILNLLNQFYPCPPAPLPTPPSSSLMGKEVEELIIKSIRHMHEQLRNKSTERVLPVNAKAEFFLARFSSLAIVTFDLPFLCMPPQAFVLSWDRLVPSDLSCPLSSSSFDSIFYRSTSNSITGRAGLRRHHQRGMAKVLWIEGGGGGKKKQIKKYPKTLIFESILHNYNVEIITNMFNKHSKGCQVGANQIRLLRKW